MRAFNLCLPVLVILLWAGQTALAQAVKLKPVSKTHLRIPEPSDVCLAPDGQHLYIVSDNGLLFKTDLNGTVVMESPLRAYDLEGVYADEQWVYAVDERTRKIHLLEHKDLKQRFVYEVPYMASRNKGYESITYNPVRKALILISEKDPTTIFELDGNYRVNNEVEFNGLSDISAATFYNGKIYILSDEAHQLWECDADSYAPLRKFKLPVINPEGVCFDKAGNLLIVSDDRGILYNFGPLPAAQP